MEITDMMEANLLSIQNAIGTAVLRSAMNQTPQAVNLLIQGMQEVNAKVMENSVYPYLGGNLDVRI